ncbi:flagellar biosynthetic protein FliR [Brevirhabdus pacifica]|uniref:Flagellar biosynthetic protein FliR n=2 Tax=Brevirhabdus pacifica TaxID=1267768 RepID=A0A1U7DM64_9RHOB|nr:flagellar biosynthetic protein FliR [Brevirhabdus pacifica]
MFTVFARLGSVLMFLPGFGESMFPMRHRLAFAVLMSIALAPAAPVGPQNLDEPVEILALLAKEVTIGLWIGLTARVLMSALQMVGYQVGMVSGLANAFAPNTGSFEGATLLASVLMMAGITLIFATDLHHVMIGALMLSYEVFPLGRIMPGDLAEQSIRAAARSFYIGIGLSAPFYVMGLVLNAGLGLANRMMPNLPVFFVAAPVLIGTGLFVLVVAAPHVLRAFLDGFAVWFGSGFSF